MGLREIGNGAPLPRSMPTPGPRASSLLPRAATARLSSARALLQKAMLEPGTVPWMTPALREALERAVLSASPQGVLLAFLDGFGDAGNAAAAELAAFDQGIPSGATPMPLHEPPGREAPPASAHADSLFNPRGRGNVSGQAEAVEQAGLSLGNPDLARVRVDDTGAVKDPNTVVTEARPDSAGAEVKAIVERKDPRGAELVAQALASAHGRFDAANTPQHRAAILDALTWIADTRRGLAYDDARNAHPSPDTQSPNETLARRSGVCRDIHTATAAILASLMNATVDAGGRAHAGSCDGREGDVQSIGFDNPNEYHAFMVYRDPATGRWGSLEYEKRYALNAATALDAMRQTTGSLTGFTRYTLRGWNGRPVVTNLGALSAARSNAFLSEDAGTGAPGELRLTAARDDVQATGFLTKDVSVTGSVDPSALSGGLRGGVKLNYHHDFERADAHGFLHAAAGVTSDFADESQWTTARGEDDRARFHTYVVGFKVDGRLEGKERALLAQHLKATWGVDLDALGGVPVAKGAGDFVVPVGAITDYSKLDLGADGGLSGREQLSPNLTLDWAVRVRAQVNAVAVGSELVSSGGQTAERSLLEDPGRAEVALALTHRAGDGTVTRLEAGGTALLQKPYDPQTLANEVHHAVLTVSPKSGEVSFGVLAKGETLAGHAVPVDALGVAVTLHPNPALDLGLGASSAFQGGDVRRVGENVQVLGSAALHF